ncbi:hypothetical protein LEN26_007969 [Aphanomyces euteiches]|nr:hypothetical protein AeMF1_019807 [Aphanomyces euteiches]KAH9131040.1 hypothetical protein LEN26_007969 [Aphanomyces euteiches]
MASGRGRSLIAVDDSSQPMNSSLPYKGNSSSTKPQSAVSGFYLSVLEAATTSSIQPPQTIASVMSVPKLQKLSSLTSAGLKEPALTLLDPRHSTSKESHTDIPHDIKLHGDNIDDMFALMRDKKQELQTQVVCVHKLLAILRHEPSDFVLHSLARNDVVVLLLSLVREFRFHAPLQADILHTLMLLAKMTAEHAQTLLHESAATLVAKTMALHPNEDRLQQYGASLLHTLRITEPAKPRGQTRAAQIAYFDSQPATPTARQMLWNPEPSCPKHIHAVPVEPVQLVSAKSQILAERSRTPELSQSKLRRALSSRQIPRLSPDCVLVAQTPPPDQPVLARPESCPTFDNLTIDVHDFGIKPWTAQQPNRQRLTPMSPSLRAYCSSPLFVEPMAISERIGVKQSETKPMGAKKSPKPLRNTKEDDQASRDEPPLPKLPSTTSRTKVAPTNSLDQHRAAKCLQRYFRRILKQTSVAPPTSSKQREASQLSPNQAFGDLDAQLFERNEHEYILREVQANYCRGLQYHKQGKYELAREAYDSAVDLKARISFISLSVNIGATYLCEGNYAKALHAFETALHQQPNHAKAMYNCGLAYWHQGDVQTAALKFSAVLTLVPSHAKAIYALHILRTNFGVV